MRTTFNHPENFIKPLRELVSEGGIPMPLLNSRVKDVLRVKFKEGLFDNPYRDEKVADKIVKKRNPQEYRSSGFKGIYNSIEK